MTGEETSRWGRKNHANAVVILLAIMICLAVTRSAGYVAYTQSRPGDPFPQLKPEAYVQNGTLSDPTGRKAALDALATEGMLISSINATSSMEDGKSMANLVIESPPNNEDRFTVTIIREDTGEELLHFSYLDPEQYIEEVPLDVGLEAREYTYIANFDAYHVQDNAYIRRGVAHITLCIKN